MAGKHRKHARSPVVTAAGVTTVVASLSAMALTIPDPVVATPAAAAVTLGSAVALSPAVTEERWLAGVPRGPVTAPAVAVTQNATEPTTPGRTAAKQAVPKRVAVKPKANPPKATKQAATKPVTAPAAPTGHNASHAAAKAVSVALAQRGVMYKWGGTTPAGFDCSGLVGYAYRHAGINLPRTSSAMAGIGRTVPLSQVRPGDLLHYDGHVALAIGNGQLVESSTHGQPVATRAIYGRPTVKRIA